MTEKVFRDYKEYQFDGTRVQVATTSMGAVYRRQIVMSSANPTWSNWEQVIVELDKDD